MFKKTRRKIVISIMSVLIALWVATLGIIYLFSFISMSKENTQMLKTHAQRYVLNQDAQPKPPDKFKPNEPEKDFDRRIDDSPVFKLSTFYTVALSYEGDVIETVNDKSNMHSDEYLENLAQEIAYGTNAQGKKDNLLFYRTDKNGYTLVVFMDNTVINEGAATLLKYTAIFGGLAIMLFFFVSLFLAGRIVAPIEQNYNKQKQFISDAGHELKTPVSVISANAELLSRELGENKWLSNIQYENERMGKLVGQLLELARTEKITLQNEYIDFTRLVCGETLAFESVAFEKGRRLVTEIAPHITVEGDSSALKQLIAILLDNAITHGENNSEICVRLTKEHSFAKLSVINEGEEIPKDQMTQIFERFYRADTVRNGEDRHYGLGLAIAKSIASAHKGNIEVLCYDSKVEFRVMIPVKN